MKAFFLILSFVCISTFAFADEHWVAFSTQGDEPACWLMKIDDSGTPTVQPKIVAHALAVPTITRLKTNRIGYFFRDTSTFEIFRVLIDESTLSMTTPKKLSITSTGFNLQATQHSSPEFIATETGVGVTKGFELNTSGAWDGESWRVNPRIAQLDVLESGVSPDGRMAWASLYNGDFFFDPDGETKFYLQPLRDNGLPQFDPNVAGAYPFSPQADLTDVLPNGRRFLVFSDLTAIVTRLQRVDGETGAKIGAVNTIINDAGFNFGNNAIQAQGEFVVLSLFDATCGPSGANALFLQSLDSAGNATGALIRLLDCDFWAGNDSRSVDVMD